MATHHRTRRATRAGTPGTAPRSAADRAALVEQIHDDLLRRLQGFAAEPAQWVEFLDQVAVFGARYSLRNQILLAEQARQRGIVPRYFLPFGNRAGTSGWLACGRRVRAGERAFHIWAPIRRRVAKDAQQQVGDGPVMGTGTAPHAGQDVGQDAGSPAPQRLAGFRLAAVFELSQTDGAPFEPPTVERRRRMLLPAGRAPQLLLGDDPTNVFTDLVALFADAGYQFQLDAPGSALLGDANGRTRVILGRGRPRRSVTVRNNLSGAQQVKTMLHELAHIRCGHLDDAAPGEPAVAVHEGRAETEAESVAHVVCAALGLDTSGYSDPYVFSWAGGDLDLIRSCGDRIVRVARDILADLDPLDGWDTPDTVPPDTADATDGRGDGRDDPVSADADPGP
ncbi:hypothetical protein ACQP00_21875 [Dactylosporangium sp. CS-047395]|uniref:hypothetical protein n=1 Tax=Dactylosporangium sp. CS-047395 TaxID=3239936 RepID=UPI003D93D14A